MYINDSLDLSSDSLLHCSDMERSSANSAAAWRCISNTRYGTHLLIGCGDSLPKSHFLLSFAQSTSALLREQCASTWKEGRLVYNHHGVPFPLSQGKACETMPRGTQQKDTKDATVPDDMSENQLIAGTASSELPI